MTPQHVLIALAFALYSTGGGAQDHDTVAKPGPQPLEGDYQLYAGTLSEMRLPDRRDSKVSFMLKEPLAKELFGRIGPDSKTSCGEMPGYRERARGDLTCTTKKEGGFTCYFGLNVATGRSMNGSTC